MPESALDQDCGIVPVSEGVQVLPAKRGRGRLPGYTQPDKVREQIRVTMLMKRLTRVALGRVVSGQVPKIADQIKAADVVLRKALPDLQTVQVTGDPEHPLEIVTRME